MRNKPTERRNNFKLTHYRFFVSFDFTSDALQEIRRFQQKTGKVIKPLKVADMLDDDKLVYQLA